MPSARELLEQRAELRGLGLVLTRRRFVEEQHLGLRRERPAELHEPALAGRQRVDALVGDRAQPDPVDDRLDDLGRVVLVLRASPCRMSAATRMFSRTREQAEELEPLERPGQPEPGPLRGAELGDVPPVRGRPARSSAGAGR